MIKIVKTRKSVHVIGHAGYDEYGKDIVCASISALFQTFVESVDKLTCDKLKTFIGSGMAYAEYENLSERGQVLLDSFLVGCEMVANTYPDNVEIV